MTSPVKRGILLRVERFSREHYGLVFLAAALAVAGAVWVQSRLKLESDVLSLVPEGNPKVDTYKQALSTFGSLDLLLVLLEAEHGAGPDELEDFADGLAGRLQSMPRLVEHVEYRLRPDDAFLRLFQENALLFVPPDRLPELASRLSDEGIRRQVRENRLALASPAAGLSGALLAEDPLGLLPFFFKGALEQRRALKVDLSDGYYLSKDGRSLILLVKPRRPSQDLDFNRELMAAVRAAAAETARELADDTGSTGVRARFGGNYPLLLEETELIRGNFRFNLFFSLFAVIALYFVSYRRVAALLYSSIPLLVGQAVTLAAAWLVLGGLNAVSVSFTAMLMGLGTDFTIVMYARYVEERRAGATLAEGTERMVGETGIGVFTGAITSAGTFYAMCLSNFRGLFDLGFLIGTGIVVCAVAILFLLPAMITWNEGVRPRKVDSLKKLHLQSFGLEHLIPFAARHRVPVLAVLGVLTVAGGWLATRLEFDDSIKALRSNRTEAGAVQEQVAETFGATLSPMMAIASGATEEEALERMQGAIARLQPFVENGVVGSYESILTHLPPVSRQEEVIRAVQADASGAFDARRVKATLVEALEENGFRPEAFADAIDRMERFLDPRRPVTLEDLEEVGLGALVERYAAVRDGQALLVTYFFPTDAQWRRRPPPGLVEQVSGPGVVVTGGNIAAEELRRIFVRDAWRSVLAGLVLVFLLLVLDFRSLRLSLVAMGQVIMAVLMMFGLMKLAGITINSANAFVATMILGVGIDYSIHMVHRLHATGGRIEQGTLETGKAVVLAAFTNVAGFGTLILGNYPALRSFGTVALFGSLTSLITALTLVPALMARREDR